MPRDLTSLSSLRSHSAAFWCGVLLLVTISCLFGCYYLPPAILGGEQIATLDSAWQGQVTLRNGRLHLSGNENRNVLQLPMRLVPGARYDVIFAASSPVALHLGLGAPGTSEPSVGKIVEAPLERAETYRVSLSSAKLPEAAFFRIYFEGQAEVVFEHLSIARTSIWGRSLRQFLPALPFLLWGMFFWRNTSRDLFTAFLLGAAVFILYLAVAEMPGATTRRGDNQWYVPTALSLLKDGDFDLSDQPPERLADLPYTTQPYGDGKAIITFPIGTALLILPAVLVAQLIHVPVVATGVMIAKILAAASVVLFFLCLRQLDFDRTKSILLSLVFALASSHFSLHAGGLWSHNASLFLSLVYFLLLLQESSFARLVAAPIGALGYIVRPDFAPLILGGVVYLFLVQDRRLVVPFLLLTVLSLAPFFIWSLGTFDTLVPPFYRSGRLQIDWQMLSRGAGQLFSPNRGLFVFHPFLFLAVGGVICSFLAEGRNRLFFRMLSGVCLLHGLLIAAFPYWWAGFCFGPRYYAPILGLLFLLTAPFFQWAGSRPVLVRMSVLVFAVVAAGWGGFVHYRGATAESVHQWSATPSVDEHPERAWNWRDMQIFR